MTLTAYALAGCLAVAGVMGGGLGYVVSRSVATASATCQAPAMASQKPWIPDGKLPPEHDRKWW